MTDTTSLPGGVARARGSCDRAQSPHSADPRALGGVRRVTVTLEGPAAPVAMTLQRHRRISRHVHSTPGEP